MTTEERLRSLLSAEVKANIQAVIDRWYHLGLLRFSSRDDGSDDLILRDELSRAALAVNVLPKLLAVVAAARNVQEVSFERAEGQYGGRDLSVAFGVLDVALAALDEP